MSLEIYRYHNPAKCDSQDTAQCFRGPADNPRAQKQLRKPCPLWVRGTDPSGNYVRQSLKKLIGYSTRDWNEAQQRIHAWQETGKQPEPVKPVVEKRASVERLHEMYVANMKSGNLASETVRKTDFLFKQMTAFAEQQNLEFIDEWDRTQVEAFRVSWTDGALTRQKRYERVRSVFKYAVAHGFVQSNPTEHLKGIKVKNGDKVKDFSEHEMRAIFAAAKADENKKVFALILVMRYAGFRISDATMLNEKSLKGNQATIRTIKTDAEVSIALPDLAVEQLQSIKREHDGYFFWNGRSTLASLTDLYRDHHLRRVFKVAGIRGTPHMFRHTFVHNLLNQGLSMREVAAAIGDTVQITERHYGKWNVREQERLNRRIVAVNEQDEVLAALSKPPAHVVQMQAPRRRVASAKRV
jgi:site-specific recombinase XerD